MPPYVIQRSPRWRRSMTRNSDAEIPTLFIISNAFRCADCGHHDLQMCNSPFRQNQLWQLRFWVWDEM